MKIKISSVFVDDQEKALQFYTDILGFTKKSDIPAGEYRWLTVVSPEALEGMELLLEPNVHEAAKAYQKALYEDGIPATMLFVDDLKEEFDNLKKRGVNFIMEPTESDSISMAVLDDTCGNLIQLVQEYQS